MSPPDFSGLRGGRPECPSDFTLDRLHAGELSQAEAQETQRHVATCAACGARMAERRAGFDGIEGVAPRVMLARIRQGLDTPPSLSQRLLGGLRRGAAPLAALTVAAIAVFVFVRPGVEPPATRFKGSLGLHVFRLAGERAEEVVSGGTFAPGDRLRFAIDMPEAGFVKVLGVEASGALYTAWPLTPGTNTHLEQGTGIELPGAVSLDAQPGRETFHLVHCPTELATGQCSTGGANAAPHCPKGCVSTPFVMDKRQP